MYPSGSLLLVKFYILNWEFQNSELQETLFHTFYSPMSLLLWWIILNNIILIFFFRYFIVLCLCFYIRGYSTNKIHAKHLRMRITAIQISDLCSEILRVWTSLWNGIPPILFKFFPETIFINSKPRCF